MKDFDVMIGLEIHAELNTKTKVVGVNLNLVQSQIPWYVQCVWVCREHFLSLIEMQ